MQETSPEFCIPVNKMLLSGTISSQIDQRNSFVIRVLIFDYAMKRDCLYRVKVCVLAVIGYKY
jgi:hypothetical protein